MMVRPALTAVMVRAAGGTLAGRDWPSPSNENPVGTTVNATFAGAVSTSSPSRPGTGTGTGTVPHVALASVEARVRVTVVAVKATQTVRRWAMAVFCAKRRVDKTWS